uniref:TGF-beta family profile domain-containing protein n=1 Tax=Cairina moschata TaxID=8855 RepID=A0A8C3C6F6_CAIMO
NGIPSSLLGSLLLLGGGSAQSSGGAPPQRPPAAPPSRGAAGGGSPELPPPPPPRRLPRGSGGGSGGGAPPCGLRSVAVRVRDLGLGYPSEETVLFRYCGGACPAPPSNHGLALARLRPGGGPGGAPGGAGPCCRPSRYEDAAFLDERHRWHQLRQLSAAACRCVG